MRAIEFIPTFAQPISTFDVELGEEFNKDLIEIIKDLMLNTEQNYAGSTMGGWRNKGNFFCIEHPIIKKLENVCASAAIYYLEQCQAEINIKEHVVGMIGWANWNKKGDYNTPHNHIGADVSGCYYIQQPDNEKYESGAIEFLDIRNIIPLQERLGGPIYSKSVRKKPKTGELLVFPSSLTHWVHPNQSDQDRIVVAWNATLYKEEDQ